MNSLWKTGIIVFLGIAATVFASRVIGPPDDPFDASLLRDHPVTIASTTAGDTTVSVTIDESSYPVININVDVLDDFGVPIGGLTESDFCVTENGQPVAFELTPVQELGCPTSICLVMDVSGSMAGDAIDAARLAAKSFINEMGPYDRVAVVSFSDCVTIEAGFTSDKQVLLDAIDSLQATGLTASFDGIYEGAQLTAQQPGDRAVIAFSDGCDNNSGICSVEPDGWSDEDGYADDSTLICDIANASGVSLYTLTFGPVESTCLAPMAAFAGGTGGYYRHAPDASVIDSLYRAVRISLCSRYIISYRSPDTSAVGAERLVSVCLDDGECTVCAGGSYQEPNPPVVVRTDETVALEAACQPTGNDLTVAVDVLNDEQEPVTAAELFYRPLSSEGLPFTSVTMSSLGSGRFAAAIASSSLPPAVYGLEYFVSVSNTAATVTIPASQPYQYPFVISYCPNTGPDISELASTCHGDTGATVSAFIVDTLDFVERATLFYRDAGGILYDSSDMIMATGTIYEGTVPGSIAAGLYEVIIRAVDNLGLTTTVGPLVFECDSLPPDTVIPTDEWIVALCSNPSLGGHPLETGDLISAFDPDGVRCGEAVVSATGMFGPMRIYRDDPNSFLIDEGALPGDEISFAVNGQDVVVSPAVAWTFHQDTVEVCDLIGCQSFSLSSGWNLISWNRGFSADIDSLVSLLGGPECVDVILGFDDGGLVYDPDLPVFSTLDHVNFYHGYWVKLICDAEFSICADTILSTEAIPISSGWNLVSYWPDTALTVGNALAFVLDVVGAVQGFDGSGTVWLPDDTIFNSLTELSPGLGYWIQASADTVLFYPGWTGPPIHSPLATGESVNPGPAATRTWMSLYGSNLTLDGTPLADGSVIAAASGNGAVCGRGVYLKGKLEFTPVYGRAPGQKETALYPVTGDSVQLFVNGTPVYPAVAFAGHGERVRLGALSGDPGTEPSLPRSFALAQNFPNPFNPSTTIEFSLPRAGRIRLTVYNLLGREVVTIVNEYRESGAHRVTWNGRDSRGNEVGSGIYLYRLTTESGDLTRKMLLVK